MASPLRSEPLVRLRDRREERRTRRGPAQRQETADGAAQDGVGSRLAPGEPQASIEQVLAVLPPSGTDDLAQTGPRLARGAVQPEVVPSLALFAGAISDGSVRLDPELVFGARAGSGVAVDRRRWAGLSPAEVEAAIRELLAEGTVLVLRRVRDLVPFARHLADAMARSAQARTDINVYVSAAEGCGFSAHDDDHDVVVVQCSGHRRWTLFTGGRPNPLPRDVDPTFDVPPGGDVQLEVDLEPGDTLYVPRGTWHVVDDARMSNGQPSLHMSIGIYRLTGADLLNCLLARILRDEVVRADLPLGADPQRLAAHLQEVAERVEAAVDDLRSLPSAQVAADLKGSLPLLDPIGPTRLTATTGKAVLARCCHPVELFTDEQRTVFFAGGQRWHVPREQRGLCERLLNSTEAAPVLTDSLDDDGRAVLTQLDAAGLVRIV